jgi:hypothetical protein
MIRFYHEWIPLFEICIERWQSYIKKLKPLGVKGEEVKLRGTWGTEDDELAHELLDEVVKRPMLARPNYSRRMYLKTDWSITGMAGVLQQADRTTKKSNQQSKRRKQEDHACLTER